MSSRHEDRSKWLIGELQSSMMTFDNNTTSLLQGQKKSFDLCCTLLRKVKEGLETRSKASRSVRQRAYELLCDVYQSIGPEVFLLCTVGPTITKLGENALHIRLSTIQNWWDSALQPQGLATVAKELFKANGISSLVRSSQKRRLSEGLEASALSWRQTSESRLPALPSTEGALQIESDEQAQNIQEHRRQDILRISSNNSNLPIVQEQQVLENASLRGVANVFDGYMCNAIRRVTVDGELKAAITMVFPGWGGPVDCLMSLDICEWDIAQLAMALFNAKVKWTGHVLHVVLKNGMMLTTETSEFTLKGVEDEAIIKVFGSKIHHAITECAVQRRELAEGKQVTECVSMILTKSGAIINLSLGLEGGLQIENRLYT